MSPQAGLEQNPVYLRAMREHLDTGRPWAVTIEVTYACNLNCGHCYVVEGRTRKSARTELSREEMENILDQLRDMGVFLITFTGGEFFTHRAAFDYLEMATRRGFAVRVFSNLVRNTSSDLERLLEYNVFIVETSLHGDNARTHDAFTGIAGSFDRMKDSVRRLRKMDIPVIAKVCWTKHNWRQHEGILKLCADLDAEFRGTCFIQRRNDGTTGNLDVRMNDEELYAFTMAMHRLHASPEQDHALQKIKGPDPDKHVCGAARVSFRIDPYGDVFPCVEMLTSAGNLRESSLKDIWTGSPVLGEIRAVRQRDFDFNDGTVYGAENDLCMLCIGANLKEKDSMTKVAEEPKRLGRIMGQARRDYLREIGARRDEEIFREPEDCAE